MAFLTGPSGAGKRSILKLIALIERPSRGQVIVHGQNTAGIKARGIPQFRCGIGVVFQDHKLLHDRPVADNVTLPLIIAGTPKREVDKRVRAATGNWSSAVDLSVYLQKQASAERVQVLAKQLRLRGDVAAVQLDYGSPSAGRRCWSCASGGAAHQYTAGLERGVNRRCGSGPACWPRPASGRPVWQPVSPAGRAFQGRSRCPVGRRRARLARLLRRGVPPYSAHRADISLCF